MRSNKSGPFLWNTVYSKW